MLTIDDLKTQKLLLFETIAGSRAYGLDLPDSDTDIKGVFYLPKKDFYGLTQVQQINNSSNDIVYYELGRFVELLLQSNPNLLELLAMPEECILHCSPIFNHLKIEWFLSKQCERTFTGYALGQIKKSHRLHKKIQQPVLVKKKTPLDFCDFLLERKTIPLKSWLAEKQWQPSQLGLVKMSKIKSLYAVFFGNYQGLIDKDGLSLLTSDVEENANPVGYLYFHEDAYRCYKQDFRSYQEWQEKRNPQRFTENQAHGQGYDGKNMMHTFRLLEMARGIAINGYLTVRTQEREKLLAIRRGEFSYQTLLAEAKKEMAEIHALFAISGLPESPAIDKALSALFLIRESLYSNN